MARISPNIARLFEIVTENELRELRAAFTGARPHPFSSLLGDLRNPSQAAANTGIAVGCVLDHDPDWIAALKPRILDRTDPANAASALAELRAYGGLLEAGFAVTPGKGQKGPKPEFHVDAGDGSSVLVEVHAKQIDKKTQTTLNDHATATQEDLKKDRDDLHAQGKLGGVGIVVSALWVEGSTYHGIPRDVRAHPKNYSDGT
jgi:hypothetical protein